MKQTLPFRHPYRHGFVRVAVAVPRIRVADPAFNAAETVAMLERGRGRGRGRWSPFPSSGSRPTPATTCSTSAPCSTPAKRRSPASPRRRGDPGHGDRRRAAARRPPPLQLRRGRLRRPRARRRAQDLPAELRRVLRGAPVQRRRHRARARGAPARRRDGAVRHRPAVQGDEPAAAEVPRRDLRGRVGADPAVELRRAGRRDGAGQPLGLEHHDRQVRLPAPARRPAVGALPRGLPVFVGRRRRVDHRPRLGRPGADLRERRPARRNRSASSTARTSSAPTSTSRGSRASACARTPSASRSASTRRSSSASARSDSSCRSRPRRADGAAAPGRALSLRARRHGAARRALPGGLQHPGAGAGAAPARRAASTRS